MLSRTFSRVSNRGNEELSLMGYNDTKLGQDFELGESLGEGGFGHIIKATRKCDNIQFAIKCIRFDSNKEDAGKIRREASTLSSLRHSNIVGYFNSWTEIGLIPVSEYKKFLSDSEESLGSQIKILSQEGYLKRSNDDLDDYDDDYLDEEWDYDDEVDDEWGEESEEEYSTKVSTEFKEVNYLFIQMELCDKRTLRTAIDENLYLEETKMAKYFKEICEGLTFIHQHNIVHRDLKPENIFLTNGTIKIGDFGLSKQICLENEFETLQNGELPSGSQTNCCGTPIYAAPELYHKSSFNVKADMYSLGIIYFEMCSAPMTTMEKSKIFPIKMEYLKTINFQSNNSRKKYLIKILLHPNVKERPTSKEVLKILNSDKSAEELKEVIQQNRRVPNQQIKSFEQVLKSSHFEKNYSRTIFIKAAIKIFELHGGEDIPLPIFMPSFYHHSDNLTTLLNTNGNSISMSNTSRIPFCYYLAKNGIRNIRRYSVGKAFKEGHFSPTEVQECVFDVVSAETDDHVTDAEILYIAKEIFDDTLPDSSNIRIVINHGYIFSSIMKHCGIERKDVEVISNIMINSQSESFRSFLHLNLSQEKKLFLLNMLDYHRSITGAKNSIISYFNDNKDKNEFTDVDANIITTAFKEINAVITNAKKFGIKSEFLVLPLLINQKYCTTGIMFKIMYGNEIIADGGNFESLIKRCKRAKKSKPINMSAFGISFDVEKIIELMRTCKKPELDVLIVAKAKPMAISLFEKLLSLEMRCAIATKLEESRAPLVLIQVQGEDSCVVYKVNSRISPWLSTELYRGKWTSSIFLQVLSDTFPQKRIAVPVPRNLARALPAMDPDIDLDQMLQNFLETHFRIHN